MLNSLPSLQGNTNKDLIDIYDYLVALRRELNDMLYNLDSDNVREINADVVNVINLNADNIVTGTLTGITIRTGETGTRLELTQNLFASYNDDNEKEGFCIEAYGLYDIFCSLMYRSGSIIGGMVVDDGLTLYSAWNTLAPQPLHVRSGGDMYIDVIDESGTIYIGTENVTVDFSESNAIGLNNYALVNHDHANKYVKTGNSQNLKLQAFEGTDTNYVEVWLDGDYLGQIDLVL